MDLLRILDSTPEPPIVELEIDRINDTGEYTLATPVYEFQRELTDQIVSLHYSDILKYCETNDKTELIVKSLEICIHNCTLVSSHPYLLITHYMPKNLLQRDMAVKLAETSGKFNVLKDLINVICRSYDNIYGVVGKRINKSRVKQTNGKVLEGANHKHIAVVLSNINKLIDLVEALIIGNVTRPIKLKRYVGNYLRRDHKKNEPENANVTIHLIPGDFKDVKNEISNLKFDLVIKFDDLVPKSDIDRLRVQNRDAACNTITLVPILSIEHCNIFYEPYITDPQYLYKLISAIVCLRDQIGVLPPDIFPIYNQGLDYLTGFFMEAFERENYPIWPLPDLPTIPDFSAIDVEKSLLTEVNFHYTPYDNETAGNWNNDDEEFDSSAGRKKKSQKRCKRSYYEVNRLQSNYITNPLTNNFDKLIGIFNHNIMNGHQVNYLTHKLLTQINNLYIEYDIIKQEYDTHVEYNQDEVQERIGRRTTELNKASSGIVGDIDHSSSRIELGNKKVVKREEEMEVMRVEIGKLKEGLEEIEQRGRESQDGSKGPTSEVSEVLAIEKKVKLVQNQIKIWKLSTSISDHITKINVKQEEKSYMKTEYENALGSIKESKTAIEDLKEINERMNKRYATFRDQDSEEIKSFRIERHKVIERIERAKEENEVLRGRLVKSFRYLRDSSHLKKRKGRGITPK